jgi:hypothetical protein
MFADGKEWNLALMNLKIELEKEEKEFKLSSTAKILQA